MVTLQYKCSHKVTNVLFLMSYVRTEIIIFIVAEGIVAYRLVLMFIFLFAEEALIINI